MGKGSVGGGGTGRVGAVGLHGAPAEHEQVGTPVTSSRGRGAVSSRAQSPEVQRPVQYTLRLSYDESDDLDTVARSMRKKLGRTVASAEVLRGLVAEVRNDPELLDRLTKRLDAMSS